MLPKKNVFQTCDPSQVPMFEQSFLAAWAIIRPQQIEAGSTQETELRIELARCVENLSRTPRVDQAMRGETPSRSPQLRSLSSNTPAIGLGR